MKRSEAVTYLHQLLSTYEDCSLDETQADEILEGLMVLGMLPPIEPGRTIYDLDLGVPEWEEET